MSSRLADTPRHWLLISSDAPLLRSFLAAVSGALLTLSFRGNHPSIFSFFCIVLLLVSIFHARVWVAFFCGFLHGFVFVLTCVAWIADVLSVHGGMSNAAGWGVLILIASVWGASMGIFAWLVWRLSLRSFELALVGAPFLWISTEVLRAYLPEISFPWGLLGYPAAGNPALVQLTTITGIYGVSFIVAAFNSLLIWILASPPEKRKSRLAVVSAVLVILLAVQILGPRFVPTAAASRIARVVQPNFPENEQYVGDWYADHKADLEELEQLSLRRSPSVQQPDLLVWPEAPAPFSFQDPHFGPYISRLATEFQHPVIVSIIDWKPVLEGNSRVPRTGLVPYNSAAMLNPIGQIAFTYDKIHLVPFGEYEPF